MKEKLPSPEEAIKNGLVNSLNLLKIWYKENASKVFDKNNPGVYLIDHQFEYVPNSVDDVGLIMCLFPQKEYPPKWNKYLLKNKHSNSLSYGQWYYNKEDDKVYLYHIGGKSDPNQKGQPAFKANIIKNPALKAFLNLVATKLPLNADAEDEANANEATTRAARALAVNTFLINTKDALKICNDLTERTDEFKSAISQLRDQLGDYFDENNRFKLKKVTAEDVTILLETKMDPKIIQFDYDLNQGLEYSYLLCKEAENCIKDFMTPSAYSDGKAIKHALAGFKDDANVKRLIVLSRMNRAELIKALKNAADRAIYKNKTVWKQATAVKNQSLVEDFADLKDRLITLQQTKSDTANAMKLIDAIGLAIVKMQGAKDPNDTAFPSVTDNAFDGFRAKFDRVNKRIEEKTTKGEIALEHAKSKTKAIRSEMDKIDKTVSGLDTCRTSAFETAKDLLKSSVRRLIIKDSG